jgi:twitching motility protein PilT
VTESHLRPVRQEEAGPDQAQGRPDIAHQLEAWLRELVQKDGSDLHVKVGSPPRIREQGRLRPLEREPLTVQEMDELAPWVVPRNRWERFEEDGEIDFAHSVSGVGRFRANVFRQRGSVSMVMRKLRSGGPSFEEVGLPPVVRNLSDEVRGLILVTGPTGSGKTTTLAAMIEHINATRPVHIVTIEDPIEVLYRDKQASINQREVGQDSKNFLRAIRAAMRQDPDVILIGEMRDSETVQAALQAAETGHLVLSTLHTTNSTETVNRVVDFFPAQQQNQIRFTLAGALRGIICQRLVPTTDGGRIPCLEVLVNTGRIAERIADPLKTSEIEEVVADGAYYGMRTFDQSLVELVTSGRVSVEEAMDTASNPHDFTLMLEQAPTQSSSSSFERDIKPLFRPEDRLSMKWAYDLWDLASVRENAADILQKLEKGDLPVDYTWPAVRIEMFRTWIVEGMPQ